jgi:Tol biopolymer transport system component
MGDEDMRGGWLRRVAAGIAAATAGVALTVAGWTPAQAAFPGDDGRIVFDTVWAFWNGAAASQIYSVRPDGSGLRQLTDMEPGTAAWHPAVSPTAARVAFVVSQDGKNDQVWVMRRNGSHQRPLVREPKWSQTGPSFTAGGRRVLYSRCGNYVAFFRTCKIVSVRLDGSGERTVIGGTWHPSDPVASPDGSRIAYVSDAGGFDARIWLSDTHGDHRSVVGPTFGVERLSWSPDGTHLVFTAFRSGSLYTMSADGTGLQQILPGTLFGAWSPDGSRIVSKVEIPGAAIGQLQLTATDGSDPTEIVDPSLGAGYSDWGIER